MDSIPDRLRQIRENLGTDGRALGQPLLAEFLGVGVDSIRNWEQGRRQPKPGSLIQIDLLECLIVIVDQGGQIDQPENDADLARTMDSIRVIRRRQANEREDARYRSGEIHRLE